jgi:hypothetical protein
MAEKEILLVIIKFKSFFLNTFSSKTLGRVLGLFGFFGQQIDP